MRKREHNEYFRSVQARTCSCGRSARKDRATILSWGEYLRGKWNTVRFVCQYCVDQLKKDLIPHAMECGCTTNLVGYQSEKLPSWLVAIQEEIREAECKLSGKS